MGDAGWVNAGPAITENFRRRWLREDREQFGFTGPRRPCGSE